MKYFSKEVRRSQAPFEGDAPIAAHSVDLIESLMPLGQRSQREARGQFLLEGMRSVHLAIENDYLETVLYASDAPLPIHELVRTARSRGVHCVPVENHFLLQLACGEDPQGIVGVAVRRPLSLEDGFAQDGVWIVLESIQNAGNLGSILRTSEAAGARGVIACGAQVDFLDPLVVRSSMGAFWAQKLVRASWNQMVDFKMRHDLFWYGTSGEASVPYDSVVYPRNFWLWMGDEQSGLTERALEACDERLAIPMQGRVDSLNLGVATGIMLYEARRSKSKR